jgi:glycosyltransferase involved in cell wall biosynthesis
MSAPPEASSRPAPELGASCATPPATAGSRPLDVLLVLNGSLADRSASIGGGDAVMFKVISLSNLQPDLLLPKTTRPFVTTRGKCFLTRSNLPPTLVGILVLFSVRILQAIWLSLRHRHVYDVALSSSPYSVDVIPVWCWRARHKGAIVFHLQPERKAVNLSTRIRFGLARLEQRLMLQVLRRACDFLVAGNEFTRSQLQTLMPGKTILRLDAGFDADAIDRVPEQKRDPNLACFVGRLTSQKGIFDLLRVMETIRRTRPAFRLVMVGTGPERALLEAEIQRRKLANIELAGFVANEEKFALLKRSEFFFFPSYEEGWGIALAEALYCECRCVCYELPYYRSIFGNFPAYAKLGDAEDFARAFEQSAPVLPEQRTFLRQYNDPLIARRLAEHLTAIAAKPTRS